MTRHRLMWFVVGVGIVVSGHCALGEGPREAPEVLEIKVIDTATGKAMSGVSLRYLAYATDGRGHVETTSLGPGGTTRLTWSQVEKYHLIFTFTIDGRGLKISRTIKAADANAASLILRIPTDRYKKPLIVTVLDAATGKPVANARINLSFLDTGGAGSTAHERALTTAGGKATFNWAGEGKYRIWCSQIDGRKIAGFYRPSDLTDDEWKAGKLTWKMKVPKLSARVKVFLLSGGKKIPAPDGAGFGIRSLKKAQIGTSSKELQAVCKDGKAKFYGLEAGSTNMFCVLSGVLGHKSGILGTRHAPIGVKPWPFKGKVLDLEVTLVSAKEYQGKLTVRVTDENGASVEGATVDLAGAGSGKGVTNSAGLTAWSGLRFGRYHVSVVKQGYPVVSRSGIFLPGTAEVIIMLRNGRRATTHPASGGSRPGSRPAVQ